MSWYHIPGDRQDVAVSTRVRLARNIAGYPFPARLDAAGAKAIIDLVGGVLEPNGFVRTDFADLTRAAAESLVEKRFISPRFARESLPHALFLNDACNLSVMVCEEDHIRIQCILPGFALQDAWKGAAKVEALLDGALELSFDPRLGYLTASPLHLGTALRGSVMLSLPLLGAAGRAEALGHQLDRTGLSLRGIFGDGSAAVGGLYRIASRATLGVSEEEILGRLSEGVESVIQAERKAREGLTGGDLDRLTDRIRRAEGILRHAHLLSAVEMTELLGLLRLGAAMGVIHGVKVETMTALLAEGMPATLSLSTEPQPKNDHERELLRAKAVRERIFGQ